MEGKILGTDQQEAQVIYIGEKYGLGRGQRTELLSALADPDQATLGG